MIERKVIDWEAVELEYRAGIKSLKAIGLEFGVSDAGILKRAKRDSWTRDLSAKIKAKAYAKVSADAVSDSVSAHKGANEKNIVEANAELQANIIRAHRIDTTRARNLAMQLLAELEGQTQDPAALQKLGELMKDVMAAEKLTDAYRKAISLSNRAGIMKTLADAIRSMILLEREAFGVTTAAMAEPPAAAPDLSGLSDDDLAELERIYEKVEAPQPAQVH